MKEKIEQLAKEKFEYQMPGLCATPEKLEIKIQAQETYRGNIRLTNRADRRMKGVVFTDNLLCEASESGGAFFGKDCVCDRCGRGSSAL